jgi:superfamily II DNA or RNA helicase
MINKTLEYREYQQIVINKAARAFLKHKMKSALVVSPTGSGKTIMMLSILKNLVKNAKEIFGKDEIQIGWTAMRRNLLLQAEKENNELIHVPNVHYISMFEKNPPEVDLLAEDESHHTAANSAINIQNKTKALIRVGCSATPHRLDNLKLCYSTIITEAGYHRLIQDGYLSQFNQYMMPQWDVNTVTKTYLEDPERWGKTIMFFLTVNEAYEAANILKANGIKADTITGETERYEQLEEFENGETQVMTNVFVLTEGYDYSALRTVFVRDSRKGPTMQMAGRVLRTYPGKIANIIQSKNTHWPFTKTAKPFQQFLWDNEWINIGSNEMVDLMYDKMTKRIIQIEVNMPQFILNKQKKKNGIKY